MKLIQSFELDHDNWFGVYELPNKVIDYFWNQIEIAKKENISHKQNLVGNISSSLILRDPDNIIINEVFKEVFDSNFHDLILKRIQENTRSFYTNPKSGYPVLNDDLWVNFQKKHEFNPIHDHSGMFSFVIWMKIPYNHEDEIELPIVKDSNSKNMIGNFCFLDKLTCIHSIEMSKNREGHCAFFPSCLQHMVYPFYTSDEERISISGNIFFNIEH